MFHLKNITEIVIEQSDILEQTLDFWEDYLSPDSDSLLETSNNTFMKDIIYSYGSPKSFNEKTRLMKININKRIEYLEKLQEKRTSEFETMWTFCFYELDLLKKRI